MRTACMATAVLALFVARAGHAQDDGDVAAYAALVLTPTAAFTPVPAPYMTGLRQSKVGISGLYGRMSPGGDAGTINTVGADVTFPAGKGTAGVIIGYLSPGCEECDGAFLAGAHVAEPLLTSGTSEHGLFAVGFQGTLGFAKPSDGTALSAAAELPLSVAVLAGRAHIVPFVSPGFGFGRVSAGGDSQSGTRFMVGGGIGVMDLAPGLGLSLGARKVFISGGSTVFGASVSWTGARK